MRHVSGGRLDLGARPRGLQPECQKCLSFDALTFAINLYTSSTLAATAGVRYISNDSWPVPQHLAPIDRGRGHRRPPSCPLLPSSCPRQGFSPLISVSAEGTMRATILVVEDDADARAQLVTLLESQGYMVAVANNGHAALAYLCSQAPPCVSS
jgi:hypothetical protein